MTILIMCEKPIQNEDEGFNTSDAGSDQFEAWSEVRSLLD